MLKQWAFPLINIPIYSLNSDLPLSLGHIILFGRLRLVLGITSRIEDFLFHQRAESISLWYSQSSYSLIEIIIVSGNHIQEIEPRRWRLKTMYAPCCSWGADILFLLRELVWRWWGAELFGGKGLWFIWKGFNNLDQGQDSLTADWLIDPHRLSAFLLMTGLLSRRSGQPWWLTDLLSHWHEGAGVTKNKVNEKLMSLRTHLAFNGIPL